VEVALIIPSRRARRALKLERVNCLTWTTKYPMSFFSLGSLRLPKGDVLDGLTFLVLREVIGASIETTAPWRVCRALGVAAGEQGIFLAGKRT